MYFLIKFLLLLLSLSSRFFFLLSDVHELWLQPVTSSLFSSAHMMSCTYDVIAHRGNVTSWLKWSSSWVFYGFGFRMRSLLFNNKTLMKVVLTLSFVSNERVTDLMSHDAEEIWWGHPLNFSQCSLAGISWNSLVGLRTSRTSLCETIFCILCVSNRSLWCCFITCPCILPVGLKGRRYLENSSDDKLSKQPQHFLIRTNSVCSDSLWWTSPHIFVITVVTGPQFGSSLTSRFKPFIVSWADEFSSRDV